MRSRKIVSGFILVITCCHPFYAQVEAAMVEQKEAQALENIRSLFEVEDMFVSTDAVNSLMTFLRSIPSDHYENLATIKVGRFHEAPRGQTGGEEIRLNINDIDSKQEFLAVFIHELAHVVDLVVLNSSETKVGPFHNISWKTKRQLRPDAKPADFVSGYAMTNAWEDFAESYLMYVIRGKTFDHWRRSNAALNRKYNFLKQKLFGQRDFLLADNMPILDSRERTWDVTLHAFSLDQLLLVLDKHKEERETVSRMRHKRVARYQRDYSG